MFKADSCHEPPSLERGLRQSGEGAARGALPDDVGATVPGRVGCGQRLGGVRRSLLEHWTCLETKAAGDAGLAISYLNVGKAGAVCDGSQDVPRAEGTADPAVDAG